MDAKNTIFPPGLYMAQAGGKEVLMRLRYNSENYVLEAKLDESQAENEKLRETLQDVRMLIGDVLSFPEAADTTMEPWSFLREANRRIQHCLTRREEVMRSDE